MGHRGLPVGTAGKGMLLLSGGIDSPVAAYLTMKRGLKIECIHFTSEPYTSRQALEKVLALARKLSVSQEEINVHVIPFTRLQLAIYKNVETAGTEAYIVEIEAFTNDDWKESLKMCADYLKGSDFVK